MTLGDVGLLFLFVFLFCFAVFFYYATGGDKED